MAPVCVILHEQSYMCKHMPTFLHACARTHTHTQKYVILTAFHGNSGFMNMNTRQCYITHTLPLLLYFIFIPPHI